MLNLLVTPGFFVNISNSMNATTLNVLKIEKSGEKAIIHISINDTSYKITIHDKWLEKNIDRMSDTSIKEHYHDHFTKITLAAQLIDLKSGEALIQVGKDLSFKGLENEKIKTHELSNKTKINLPERFNDKIKQIKKIYGHTVTRTIKDTTLIRIGKGSAKLVWVEKTDKKSLSTNSKFKGKVIYTPNSKNIIDRIFQFKKKEIYNEHALQVEIIRKSPEKLRQAAPAHIAVDMEILEEDGEFIATATEAEGDLEHLMTVKNLSSADAAQLAFGFVKGMDELATLGYASGDVKPENALGYRENSGKIVIKLSDLGKAQLIGDQETKLYAGNMGFAPPEKCLSKMGDVFALGMITLRVFEERIFAKTKRSSLNEELIVENGKEIERARGLELFRRTHPAFAKHHIDILFPTNAKNLKEQEEAMKKYIQDFKTAFTSHFPDDLMTTQLDRYCALLDKTFSSNPKNRPTAREFKEEFEKIVNNIESKGSK